MICNSNSFYKKIAKVEPEENAEAFLYKSRMYVVVMKTAQVGELRMDFGNLSSAMAFLLHGIFYLSLQLG